MKTDYTDEMREADQYEAQQGNEEALAAQNSGHTPGPWKVMPAHGTLAQWAVGTEAHRLALIVDGDNARAGANARLIAAAPELLEALRITQRTTHGSFADGWSIRVTGHEMNAIRAAIAKAKGA